jgi:hypothetical protein
MILPTLLRWMCDPAKLEAIEGDLAEVYGGRQGWRYVRDVLSVCLRQPRTAVRSLAATVLLLLLMGRAGPLTPRHYTVFASDPGGAFTIEIHTGRVIAATLGAAPVRARDLLQRGDTVIIRGGDAGNDFRITIKPEGGIAWSPRHSSSH